MSKRVTTLIAAAAALCAGRALATDFPVALNYNWNGMVHPGETGQPDAPQGFRTISDRALSIGGGANDFGTSAIVGSTSITYTINTNSGVLDIVHLGDT